MLFDNNLEVAPGEIVIMTGPSGSGKTTLLTLIGTLRTVQEGSVNVLGNELRGATAEQRIAVRRELGFIFQHHNLFASLTALENVRMGLELFQPRGPQIDRRATDMLTRLGLGHRCHYKPENLSGGQKQRIAIARALAHGPRLVLADEPTAALDGKSGREVVTLFQEFARTQKCTILMVTHDNRILDIADRIVNMVDGRIVSSVLVQESALICDFLANCPLFAPLTPRTLSYVADHMKLEVYSPGAVVTRQGDPGDKFYMIRSGSVDVIKEEAGRPSDRESVAAWGFLRRNGAADRGSGATQRSWRPRKSRSMRWARAISTPSSWPARRWRKSCARRSSPVNERRQLAAGHPRMGNRRHTAADSRIGLPESPCACCSFPSAIFQATSAEMASLSAWKACSWAALMSKVVAVSAVCFSRSPRTFSCQLSHSCLATAAWRSRDWTSHAAWRMSSSASIVLSAKSRSNCAFRVCSSHSSWAGAIIFNSLRSAGEAAPNRPLVCCMPLRTAGRVSPLRRSRRDLQNRDVGPHGYARCHCGLAVHPCHRHRQIRDRSPRDGGLAADAQQPAQLPFDLLFAGVQFDLPANQFEPLPLQGGIIAGQRDSPLLKLPVVGDRLIGFPQTAP